jgi:cell division protein FtsL
MMRALMERTHHLRDASIDQMSRLSVHMVRLLVVLLATVVPTVTGTFWLRFAILENRAVGLSCREGSEDWLCLVRNAATFSYEYALLGSFAVLLAAVNLVRPSYVTFAVATVAATIGAILYNVGGAGIAITLLILSLARRERETV